MGSPTILHVEDDTNDVLLLQHARQRAGLASLQLCAANDGEEAIAYLDGSRQYADRKRFPVPQLVLLDLKMPRVNGFEVLSWIRRTEQTRCVPVVILTSSNHEADIRRAYDLGANSYLVKPVGFEELVSLIRMLFDYWLTLNLAPEH